MKFLKSPIIYYIFGILIFIVSILLNLFQHEITLILLKYGSIIKNKPIDAHWSKLLLHYLSVFSIVGFFLSFISFFFRNISNFFIADRFEDQNDELLKFLTVLFFSFVIFLFTGTFFILLYKIFLSITHYNSKIQQDIITLFYKHENLFSPEPLELFSYIILLVTMPSCFIVLYHVYPKMYNFTQSIKNKSTLLFSLFFIVLIIVLCIDLVFVSDGDKSNFLFYFSHTVITNYFLIYSLLVFPTICFLLLKPFFIGKNFPIIFTLNKMAYFASLGIIIFSLINIMLMNLFTLPYKGTWHFEPVYYPLLQLVHGTPLLMDGFTSIYGGYPYILLPLFKIIKLSIFNFSCVMSFLIVLSFVLFLITLKNLVKSKPIFIFGISTLLFFTYIRGKIVITTCSFFDYYFQYHPLRIVFAGLLLYTAIKYLKTKNKIIYFASFFISSISIIWNPETGIVLSLSWIAFLCYTELMNCSDLKNQLKKIAHHVLFFLASILITFALFSFLVFIAYHRLPDITLLFATMKYSSKYGYYMLPLPPFHPWHFIIIIYLIGVFSSLRSLFLKKKKQIDAFIFLVSIMGLGLFTYYLGRSHNWNLLSVSIYAIILLTIYADLLYQKLKAGTTLPYKLFFFSILYFLSFSFLDLALNLKQLMARSANGIHAISEIKHTQINSKQSISNRECFDDYENYKNRISQNLNFIKKHTISGEKILILALEGYQCLYFDGTKTSSLFNPCFIDLFLKSDYTRLKNIIYFDNPKIFLEKSLLSVDPINHFSPDSTLLSAIYHNYKKIDHSTDFEFYHR